VIVDVDDLTWPDGRRVNSRNAFGHDGSTMNVDIGIAIIRRSVAHY